MRTLRARAGIVAALALVWHLMVLAVVSTALTCDWGPGAAETSAAADCPMHHSQPACPKHADKHGTHECDCPTLGCANMNSGFMALFGGVGVLPGSPDLRAPQPEAESSPVRNTSSVSLAPAPKSPPPRL